MKINQFKTNYRQKKKSKFVVRVAIFGGLFFVLVGVAFYVLIFLPQFKIQKILVEGNKEIESSRIEETAKPILQEKFFGKIPKDNFILLPVNKIRETILDNFPEIKDISVEKKLISRQLVLKIQERQASAIWCQASSEQLASGTSTQNSQSSLPQAGDCFFIDESGFLFANAPILSGGLLATVFDETLVQPQIKEELNNSPLLEFILEAKKSAIALGLDLSDFIVKPQTAGQIEILAPEGWQIYLSLEEPAANQMAALKKVLDEEIKNQKSRLEYIDLRVQNRVYYKFRN